MYITPIQAGKVYTDQQSPNLASFKPSTTVRHIHYVPYDSGVIINIKDGQAVVHWGIEHDNNITFSDPESLELNGN